MRAPRSIFEGICAEGEKTIRRFVDDGTPEDLFLDFKTSSNGGSGKRLSVIDTENLRTAISGFGNTEGGVLVWGVRCREGKSGADVAVGLEPVVDVQRFRSWLEHAVPRATVPEHPGVLSSAIPSKEGRGYLVTLIPKSVHPLQVAGSKGYCIRAGSSFVPAPPSLISAMYGRIQETELMICVSARPADVNQHRGKLQFDVSVRNKGFVSAKDVYFVGDWTCPRALTVRGPIRSGGETDHFEFARYRDQCVGTLRSPTFLPPGASVYVGSVYIKCNACEIEEDVRLEMRCGAANAKDFRTALTAGQVSWPGVFAVLEEPDAERATKLWRPSEG